MVISRIWELRNIFWSPVFAIYSGLFFIIVMSFFVVSDPLCLIFQHINPDSKTNKSVMNKSRTNFIVNFKPFWELTFETLTSPIFQNFIKTSAFWFRWIKYFSDFLWIWNSNFEWKKYFFRTSDNDKNNTSFEKAISGSYRSQSYQTLSDSSTTNGATFQSDTLQNEYSPWSSPKKISLKNVHPDIVSNVSKKNF